MLSSISPVGEHARNQPWMLTVVAYLVASIGAGALLGLALGAVGQVVLRAAVSPWLMVGVIALAVVGDLAGRIPSVHRQVDERWLTDYRGWVYGAGYGAQLGTGVVTIVGSNVVWAMWIAALLSADAVMGLAIGATFGLARATPLVAAGRIRTVSALRRTLAAMERVRPWVGRGTIAGQLVAVSALVAVLATS